MVKFNKHKTIAFLKLKVGNQLVGFLNGNMK